MRAPYYETTIHRQIREKRENRKERIQKEIDDYGSEILESDVMQEAYDQTHHLWATVGEHTARVTLMSMFITYALRKMNINVSTRAVVIGALCHDLGMVGRKNKYESDAKAIMDHPTESVKVAKEIVEELPEKSEEIIESHMWPSPASPAPRSVEAVVVSVADKVAAVRDLVQGSDVKNTGLKNTANTAAQTAAQNIDELRERGISRINEKIADAEDLRERSINKINEKIADVRADLESLIDAPETGEPDIDEPQSDESKTDESE